MYDNALWSKFISNAEEDDWLATLEGETYASGQSNKSILPFSRYGIKEENLYILYNRYLNSMHKNLVTFIENYKVEQNIFANVFGKNTFDS